MTIPTPEINKLMRKREPKFSILSTIMEFRDLMSGAIDAEPITRFEELFKIISHYRDNWENSGYYNNDSFEVAVKSLLDAVYEEAQNRSHNFRNFRAS